MLGVAESTERLYKGVRRRAERDEPALEQLWRLLEDLAAFNEENAPLLEAIHKRRGGEQRVKMCRTRSMGCCGPP